MIIFIFIFVGLILCLIFLEIQIIYVNNINKRLEFFSRIIFIILLSVLLPLSFYSLTEIILIIENGFIKQLLQDYIFPFVIIFIFVIIEIFRIKYVVNYLNIIFKEKFPNLFEVSTVKK